ncbi:hypothetical protein [Leptolyngbya sp. FACHB-261]|uniref:hypothetical protein n=1 Tax=Leptolyngbya sp. FACHB-261 TaxID=2692806 RepID=UPI00168767F9|nr:hypothetical protein [Leptolyngbya sp. FACHB-261]MBD2101004.1 hypothetical protein [Leptolyngbya sp. FACHB-261]
MRATGGAKNSAPAAWEGIWEGWGPTDPSQPTVALQLAYRLSTAERDLVAKPAANQSP